MDLFPISGKSKTELRKAAARIRDGLQVQAISRQIRERVESWAVFQKTETILFYSAFRNEVDLQALAENYTEKHWYLPKVEQNGNLGFYRYTQQQALSKGAYGVLEPSSSERFTVTPDGDSFLIFTPGLLFDRQGYRLGYGKGYYDRFLKRLGQEGIHYFSVGAVPDALYVDALPSEPHDIPVAWVITESGLHQIPK